MSTEETLNTKKTDGLQGRFLDEQSSIEKNVNIWTAFVYI